MSIWTYSIVMHPLNATNSDGTSMELEELDPGQLQANQRDLETIEGWAERNGIAYGVARAWAMNSSTRSTPTTSAPRECR